MTTALTIKQVAKRLNGNDRTVYPLAQARQLVYISFTRQTHSQNGGRELGARCGSGQAGAARHG